MRRGICFFPWLLSGHDTSLSALRGTGLPAVAGFSLCACVFVGAGLTPPLGAQRRVFVFVECGVLPTAGRLDAALFLQHEHKPEPCALSHGL